MVHVAISSQNEQDPASRWWFQTYFNFHPYLGIQFDDHSFQLGWENHQLDLIKRKGT